MKLEERKYYWKHLAKWMGYADSYFSYKNNRGNKLLELVYYADFEEVDGGVLIKKVKHEEYDKRYTGWLTELFLACSEIELVKDVGQWTDRKKETFAAMKLYEDIISKKHLVQNIRDYFDEACQQYFGCTYSFKRAKEPVTKINEEGRQLLRNSSLYNDINDVHWAYFNSTEIRRFLPSAVMINAGIDKEEMNRLNTLYHSFGLYDGAGKEKI